MTAADPAPRCDRCDRTDCSADRAGARYTKIHNEIWRHSTDAWMSAIKDAETAAADCAAHAQPWPERARAAEALLRELGEWPTEHSIGCPDWFREVSTEPAPLPARNMPCDCGLGDLRRRVAQALDRGILVRP